jgi:hypothetical protein
VRRPGLDHRPVRRLARRHTGHNPARGPVITTAHRREACTRHLLPALLSRSRIASGGCPRRGRSARAGAPGSGPHPTPHPLRRQGYVLAPKAAQQRKRRTSRSVPLGRG